MSLLLRWIHREKQFHKEVSVREGGVFLTYSQGKLPRGAQWERWQVFEEVGMCSLCIGCLTERSLRRGGNVSGRRRGDWTKRHFAGFCKGRKAGGGTQKRTENEFQDPVVGSVRRHDSRDENVGEKWMVGTSETPGRDVSPGTAVGIYMRQR